MTEGSNDGKVLTNQNQPTFLLVKRLVQKTGVIIIRKKIIAVQQNFAAEFKQNRINFNFHFFLNGNL